MPDSLLAPGQAGVPEMACRVFRRYVFLRTHARTRPRAGPRQRLPPRSPVFPSVSLCPSRTHTHPSSLSVPTRPSPSLAHFSARACVCAWAGTLSYARARVCARTHTHRYLKLEPDEVEDYVAFLQEHGQATV